jgi:hypothetical protein
MALFIGGRIDQDAFGVAWGIRQVSAGWAGQWRRRVASWRDFLLATQSGHIPAFQAIPEADVQRSQSSAVSRQLRASAS